MPLAPRGISPPSPRKNMNSSNSDLQTAARLWRTFTPGRPFLAMLTTASAEGVPHATWMGAILAPDPGEVLTLTSPDSLKVRNIRENSAVEWLVSAMSRKELLYLQGHAEIVEEVADLKQCWAQIPGKGQAFFLRYFNPGPGFSVIRTVVESAILVVPEEFRKVEIPLVALDGFAPP
jgi:general stress protein 26